MKNKPGSEKFLERFKDYLFLRGNPQDSFKSIHVAGTNGKGSVCTFLEQMYLTFKPELKIAKYTSPHLVSYTERISINGEDISYEAFKSLWLELFNEDFEKVSTKFFELGSFGLSHFEKLTVLAFEYFKRNKVDIAILEVGMGGRLDATNVLSSEKTLATLITHIGMDHEEYLGTSIEEIRKEKEAIKKEGVTHFDYMEIETDALFPNSLKGSNFLLAKKCFEFLNAYEISDPESLQIIEKFKLRLKGRMDYQDGFLVDSAHNPDGAKILEAEITALEKEHDLKRRVFILGFLDKNYKDFIENLKLRADDRVIFVDIGSERSTSSSELKEFLQAKYPKIECAAFSSLSEALWSFNALPCTLLILAGSLYLIGEYYSLIPRGNLISPSETV